MQNKNYGNSKYFTMQKHNLQIKSSKKKLKSFKDIIIYYYKEMGVHMLDAVIRDWLEGPLPSPPPPSP
jgi:hypothetical protein